MCVPRHECSTRSKCIFARTFTNTRNGRWSVLAHISITINLSSLRKQKEAFPTPRPELRVLPLAIPSFLFSPFTRTTTTYTRFKVFPRNVVASNARKSHSVEKNAFHPVETCTAIIPSISLMFETCSSYKRAFHSHYPYPARCISVRSNISIDAREMKIKKYWPTSRYLLYSKQPAVDPPPRPTVHSG